ncbi:hypothetical protein IAU60_001179 [Kwoniella sp. DSM 27419]
MTQNKTLKTESTMSLVDLPTEILYQILEEVVSLGIDSLLALRTVSWPLYEHTSPFLYWRIRLTPSSYTKLFGRLAQLTASEVIAERGDASAGEARRDTSGLGVTTTCGPGMTAAHRILRHLAWTQDLSITFDMAYRPDGRQHRSTDAGELGGHPSAHLLSVVVDLLRACDDTTGRDRPLLFPMIQRLCILGTPDTEIVPGRILSLMNHLCKPKHICTRWIRSTAAHPQANPLNTDWRDEALGLESLTFHDMDISLYGALALWQTATHAPAIVASPRRHPCLPQCKRIGEHWEGACASGYRSEQVDRLVNSLLLPEQSVGEHTAREREQRFGEHLKPVVLVQGSTPYSQSEAELRSLRAEYERRLVREKDRSTQQQAAGRQQGLEIQWIIGDDAKRRAPCPACEGEWVQFKQELQLTED